jgi:hypothetical protein
MKVFRGKRQPSTEQPHFTLKEIDRICCDELNRVGLLPSKPEPIRIERFIEKRFGVSPTYEDMPDGVLGFTEFGMKGVNAIVVSRVFEIVGASVPLERRLRTTLAHEAGHGLMHAHLFAYGKKPATLFDDASEGPTILCRDVIGEKAPRKGYDGRWWEYQANRAIGSLLLPRKLVQAAAAEFLTPTGMLALPIMSPARRDAAIQATADIFDVNRVVARYRLEEIYPKDDAEKPSL